VNTLKGLFVVVLLVVAFLGFRGVANADPETIDQPDLNGIICGQMLLGETPIEIAERMHKGDPRMSQQQAGQKVWETLQECEW
jgi:hypothetical protein